MGRILKKKDPIKKKAQRVAAGENGSGAPGDKTDNPVAKPVLAARKVGGSEKPKAVAKEPGIVEKSVQFLREVKIELKKVTWPTRKQTMGAC